ncbi:tripartite tricarboxylate transporter TctB family protein [Mesobacillus maritimus]|uniref:tripartite tricarboxylate transporter TctB family protein n=1 Tax=Mesobacillus maritimus TaxID=1643336 RepID=UPI00203BDE02|nr:tripartite tricarboxylate transporter TctB family protein [Mesobacillus maritimus]MCM3585963.1 tripartite tricarboxylate transporter TctB family protein [Mesobacillus maritimus]MCM3670376.1 tripartite tricarboxylate transporter TctB family protein [Mesobacillus maritimus]
MLLERTISIIMIAFSALFLVQSLQLENRTGGLVGPGTWPAALMILMLVLSIVLLVKTFLKKGVQVKTANEEAEDLANEDDQLVYPKRFFYLLGALIIYTLLLDYVGFIVDTLVFIFVLSLIFGVKHWSRGLLTGILATAGAVVLFPILLNTPFPRGVGIFSTFSLLFY